MKKYLLDELQAFLEPIRTRREELAKDPGAVMQMLKKRTDLANEAANQTWNKVRAAMGINYF